MLDSDIEAASMLDEKRMNEQSLLTSSTDNVSQTSRDTSIISSDPIENPVFQKWNNPVNNPPKINFFKFIAATRAWQRKAKQSNIKESRIVYYENTYRMEPEQEKRFSPSKVESILKETLEKRLRSMTYSADACRITTRELCADIKRKVKEINLPRYKIITEVLITENKRQGLQVSSRPLWNVNTDDFASYTYRNATIIAVAKVYGVYYE